jgi:cell division protein FtsB
VPDFLQSFIRRWALQLRFLITKRGLLYTLVIAFVVALVFSNLGYAMTCKVAAKFTTASKKSTAKIRNDGYQKHRKAAKAHHLELLQDDDDIAEAIRSEKIVGVGSGRGVRIDKLSHSAPYLLPAAKEVLHEMGRDFCKQVPGSRMIITSLTRTAESQAKLRKVNGNATRSVTTHSYGASFDISYVRFERFFSSEAALQRALNRVILKYQLEGKIYVVKERNIACFHITVRP